MVNGKEMKNMKNLFISTILCFALVMVPFGGVIAADSEQTSPRIANVSVLNGNYDDGDSPAGTPQSDDASAAFNIISDPGSDASRGNVACFKGHVEYSPRIAPSRVQMIALVFATASAAGHPQTDASPTYAVVSAGITITTIHFSTS